MNNGEESIIDIVNRVQQVLTTWQRNLAFTGGQLKLQKYYWILIVHAYVNNKVILLTNSEYQLTSN